MDKIITINLGGFSIKIDEDAFEVLKKYINALERKYSQTENGKEIINDIEARIAELLLENLNGKVASSLADVELVIKNMGNPDEFDENDESKQANQNTFGDNGVPKRLYRDGENKMLGGVCSGISKYFDIDPTIVRILWLCLVLFFGTGFLVYLILWILVPEAVTTAQKLEMTGKAPTLDNIINKVKTEAQNVEKNFKSHNFGKKIRDIIKSIMPVFIMAFKLMAIAAGIAILVFFVIFIFTLYSGVSSFTFSSNGFYAKQIPNFFDSEADFISFKVLFGMFIGIPLFNIITRLFKFASNSNINYRPVRRVLNIIWGFTIPLLLYFGFVAVCNFKVLETNTYNSANAIKSNLLIKTAFADRDLFENSNIKIIKSSDSLLHITINETASAENSDKAIENAQKIGATFQLDSNILILKVSDYYKKSKIYRRQKAEFIIEIPENVKFSLHPDFQKKSVLIKTINMVYLMNKSNFTSNELLFKGDDLLCPSCNDSLLFSGNNNIKNTNKINVEGWMDVEIVKGNFFNLQKIGDDEVVKNIETEFENDELTISMKEKILNFKSKPKIIITMPELEQLSLSGAIDCNIDNFTGKSIDLKLSGATSADVNLNYFDANIELSGVCKLNVSGNIENVKYDCEGASSLNSKKLISQNSVIDISGASQIIIGKTNSITGKASGTSKIKYTGKPFYDVKSSGMSTVEHY
ncbi:MAG: DUF2807 domain-containing protein [Bacteroidetes bacterium]|nr:DUF2807 domain-containing protein [Bacteroidota bacterium]